MNMLMALAVSIGVLIALWVKFGAMIAPGLAIAANLSGVVWALIANLVISAAGLQSMAWIVIGVVAFCIVMQSKVAALSFIPGGFAGAAVTVALVAGAVLGYISEMGAGMIAKKA